MADRIPQDIWSAAERLHDDSKYGLRVEDIARALLAERQACVDRVRSEDCGDDHCVCCRVAVARAEGSVDCDDGPDADELLEVTR